MKETKDLDFRKGGMITGEKLMGNGHQGNEIIAPLSVLKKHLEMEEKTKEQLLEEIRRLKSKIAINEARLKIISNKEINVT